MAVIKAFLLVIFTAVISSCGFTKERVVYVNDMPMPVRPVLPIIQPEELVCLSNDVYKKVRERDLLRRQYADKLEDVIKGSPSAVTE